MMEISIILERSNEALLNELRKLNYEQSGPTILHPKSIVINSSGQYYELNDRDYSHIIDDVIINCKKDEDNIFLGCAYYLQCSGTKDLLKILHPEKYLVAASYHLPHPIVAKIFEHLGFQRMTDNESGNNLIVCNNKMYGEGDINTLLEIFDPDIYIRTCNQNTLISIGLLNDENDLNQIFINRFNGLTRLCKEEKWNNGVKSVFTKANIEELIELKDKIPYVDWYRRGFL